MNNDTTKVNIRLVDVPDEVSTAQNAFAVAVKHFREDPTQENQQAMERAQNHLLQVQDAYREGRQARLQFAQAALKKQTGRRS